MLILCDFDGTFTETDITNLIWDQRLGPGWRERLLPAYREGKTTTLELMAAGYAEISNPAKELIDGIRSDIRLRAGFENFISTARARSWPLYIVSNGLEWYIRELLPPGIPVHCYCAELIGSDPRWRVTMPPGVSLQPGEDFKVHVCEKLCLEHPDRETVFIGDGRNDFPVARHCKYVFAVKDSTLAKLCAEAGKEHVEFESFDTVVEKLIAINQ